MTKCESKIFCNEIKPYRINTIGKKVDITCKLPTNATKGNDYRTLWILRIIGILFLIGAIYTKNEDKDGTIWILITFVGLVILGFGIFLKPKTFKCPTGYHRPFSNFCCPSDYLYDDERIKSFNPECGKIRAYCYKDNKK